MKKVFWTLAAFALLFACETQEIPVDDPTTPGTEEPGEKEQHGGNSTTQDPKELAITGEASEITELSAVLSGSVNPKAEMQDVLMGVFYSTESSPNIENSVKVRAKDIKDNAFRVSLEGLSSNTTYYFKTYLQYNGEQYYFGEIQSFTTLEVKASVETTGVTDVTEFRATLNGKLTLDAKVSLEKEVWFLYGKYDSLDELKENGTWLPASTLSYDGSFSASIKGLEYGAEYYFVAGAGVYDQQFYSEPAAFSTLSFSVSLTTLETTDITEFNATLNGRLLVYSKENLSRNVWFLMSDSKDDIDARNAENYSIQTVYRNDGTFYCKLGGLHPGTTYYFVACAQVEDSVYYSEVSSFETIAIPEIVDLGLSVKWRNRNLGATSPEEYGDYYAWGELEPYYLEGHSRDNPCGYWRSGKSAGYDWSSYSLSDGSKMSLTKYNDDSSYGVVDNKTVLDPEDDVAREKLGGDWRLPTDQELSELVNNCTWKKTTLNGVKGYKVTSKMSGYTDKWIFLPVAGCRQDTHLNNSGSEGFYWTSTLNFNDSDAANGLWLLYSMDYVGYYVTYRIDGLSVRPVTK